MKIIQSILFLIGMVSLGARAQQNDGRGLGVDSVSMEPKKETFQGVYLEFLGRNLTYAVGYEFVSKKGKNAFGIGVGARYLYQSVAGKKFSNFSLSVSPFYEYGNSFGLRTGISLAMDSNPIVYSNKLDYLHPADQPYYLSLFPSYFLGAFYRTKKQRFQIILYGQVYTWIVRRKREVGVKWKPYVTISPLVGLTVKYNFKNRTK
ncbi:hypothetical protein GCM10009118_04860 [Wandonia haliotis]|uniref:Outer membrane protein beta-barrel domain-containing protein n=1 Tax=Wandonia haliotis TaxID=574963 RepID=A0ABN1MLH6_9FLAO